MAIRFDPQTGQYVDDGRDPYEAYRDRMSRYEGLASNYAQQTPWSTGYRAWASLSPKPVGSSEMPSYEDLQNQWVEAESTLGSRFPDYRTGYGSSPTGEPLTPPSPYVSSVTPPSEAEARAKLLSARDRTQAKYTVASLLGRS